MSRLLQRLGGASCAFAIALCPASAASANEQDPVQAPPQLGASATPSASTGHLSDPTQDLTDIARGIIGLATVGAWDKAEEYWLIYRDSFAPADQKAISAELERIRSCQKPADLAGDEADQGKPHLVVPDDCTATWEQAAQLHPLAERSIAVARELVDCDATFALERDLDDESALFLVVSTKRSPDDIREGLASFERWWMDNVESSAFPDLNWTVRFS